MTREDFTKLFVATPIPILCRDGKFGLIIRDWGDNAGVQVPGEENIREIPTESINDVVGLIIEGEFS